MDWVNFELGEDIQHIEQDQKWKEVKQDARQHISRREECLIYKRELVGAIESFKIVELMLSLLTDKESTIKNLCLDAVILITEFAFAGQGDLVYASRARRIAAARMQHEELNKATEHPFELFIRKRPLNKHELERGVYDIVHTNVDNYPGSIMIHNGQLARNGRRLTMTHKHYLFSRVFGADCSQLEFCNVTVEPLIQNALRGLSSTLLCYGQTGTGKTYTLIGALEYCARRLAGIHLEICFYELHGKKAFDLLNNRQEVHLRSDENDIVHVRGAHKVLLWDSRYSEIMAVLMAGMNTRSSEETERNPISSRSHAICVIRIISLSEPVIAASLEAGGSEHEDKGRITFVDLAGSERNYETFSMTAAKHRESADINYSLMALKNCFRAYRAELEKLHKKPKDIARATLLKYRTKKTPVPPSSKRIVSPFNTSKALYRSSMLTRLLKECFILPKAEDMSSGRYHRTAIVATVSPSAVDAQHTINTLDHMSLMHPSLQHYISEVLTEIPKFGAALTSVPLSQWSSDQVNTWLSTVEKGRFAYLAVPPQFTGADLLKLDVNSLSTFFEGQMRQARAGLEGDAWTVSTESSRHLAISRALWNVIRREIELNKNSFF